jgi:hypothetical protein
MLIVLHLRNELDIWNVQASLKVVPVDCAKVLAWSFDELKLVMNSLQSKDRGTPLPLPSEA